MGLEVRSSPPSTFPFSAHAAAPPPQDDFKAAAEEAKTLPSNLSNDDQVRCALRGRARVAASVPPPHSPSRLFQLALYGLYKQANFGDNTTGACPRLEGCR